MLGWGVKCWREEERGGIHEREMEMKADGLDSKGKRLLKMTVPVIPQKKLVLAFRIYFSLILN